MEKIMTRNVKGVAHSDMVMFAFLIRRQKAKMTKTGLYSFHTGPNLSGS